LLKGLTCDFQVLLCSRFPLDWVRQSSLAGGRAREGPLRPARQIALFRFQGASPGISGVMHKIHRLPPLFKPPREKRRDFFRRRGKTDVSAGAFPRRRNVSPRATAAAKGLAALPDGGTPFRGPPPFPFIFPIPKIPISLIPIIPLIPARRPPPPSHPPGHDGADGAAPSRTHGMFSPGHGGGEGSRRPAECWRTFPRANLDLLVPSPASPSSPARISRPASLPVHFSFGSGCICGFPLFGL